MRLRELSALVTIACAGATVSFAQTNGSKRHIQPEKWAKPPGYSHAVVTEGRPLIFVAGQVSVDESGAVVNRADFAAQLKLAFANLETVLKAAGVTMADVVKLNYYVVGLNQERLLAIRAERDKHIVPTAVPASTLIGVSALFHPDVLIEIDAVADARTK